MKIEGGCLCGKVRYLAETEPAFVAVCHCQDCQKATGTAFATVIALPEPGSERNGQPQNARMLALTAARYCLGVSVRSAAR